MCEGMRADSTGNKWHSDELLSAPQAEGDQRGAVAPAVDEKIQLKKISHQIVSSATSVTSKKAGRRTCLWPMFQKCFSSKIPCLCFGLLWNPWVSEVWQVDWGDGLLISAPSWAIVPLPLFTQSAEGQAPPSSHNNPPIFHRKVCFACSRVHFSMTLLVTKKKERKKRGLWRASLHAGSAGRVWRAW